MKRIFTICLAAILLMTMTACRDSVAESYGEASIVSSAVFSQAEPGSEPEPSAPDESSEVQEGTSILIAYFTWADNTHVENPDAIDPDATTSASVLTPGNTTKMAGWIQQAVGGDLHSIIVEEPYSSDYDQCLDRAAEEKAQDARPALTTHVENMEDYDVVFLGFPNWWYTVPMAVLSFVEEYDWSGKTVIPFVTHGTGGLASTMVDLTAALPDDITIEEPIGVYRPEVDESQDEVQEWARSFQLTAVDGTTTEDDMERKIIMTVNGQALEVTLLDTTAANDLYDRLPLELSFEDYNGVEKIGYLNEELDIQGEPDGCDPAPGDLCYYIPWGNLSVFYNDFRYSDNLIMLGHIDEGAEIFTQMEGDFTLTLEAK